ncbi:MAG: NlpC/P60 family protein [Pseudomonadota bacterium]
MRKGCSIYSLIFALTIMINLMAVNITYAESELQQSNEASPSSWAVAEIDKATEAGLVPESLRGEYKSNITREEFSEAAVKLYEALSGKDGVSQEGNPFTDTENAKVLIAYDLGIVKGIGDGSFAPNDAITRQEISVMLYRTLKVARPSYDYSTVHSYPFSDYKMISSWAREAIGYLYSIEVVNGVGDNQFSPKENTSREEAIVLAKRLYDKALAAKGSIVASRAGTSRRDEDTRAKLAQLLSQEMGKPYRWGAEGPDSFDCSGLVYYVYGKLGISLPRVARDQAGAGKYVSKEDLEYGDLVFFARDGKNINHVGIYAGNGEFIHAPETGDVVKKSTLMSGYYERCYYTARRVLK